jgi:hypothetical protein
MNIYGISGANQKHRCHESKNYFKQCLSINEFIATDKKYNPQKYLTSEYYHVSTNHNSIDVEPRL